MTPNGPPELPAGAEAWPAASNSRLPGTRAKYWTSPTVRGLVAGRACQLQCWPVRWRKYDRKAGPGPVAAVQ
jgi:hypothetical protein